MQISYQNSSYFACAFGSAIAARAYASGEYRYGFNGMEKDDEVNGGGNIISYELRILDTRLARFFSIDPRKKEYPWQSTYCYFYNSPISIIDYKGGGAEPALKSQDAPKDEDNNFKSIELAESNIDFDESLINTLKNVEEGPSYPSPAEMKVTFKDDAFDKIYNPVTSDAFPEIFNITPDVEGRDALAKFILGTVINENPPEGRGGFVAVVTGVAIQLYDANGPIEGTWKMYNIPESSIPEGTSSTRNPGMDGSTFPATVDLGGGVYMIFVIEITIMPLI